VVVPKRTKHTKHKVTFTLDEATIQLLKEAAMVTGKSQSLIVREAVAQYGRRRDKMDPEERMHKLQVFRELRKAGPFISRAEADAEIEEIRKARREDRRNWP
jgi:hypothetical protein